MRGCPAACERRSGAGLIDLRRLRNLSIILVVVAIVVGYFTVIRRPTSPNRSASTSGGTPTAAVLANTNDDVVSIRQSDYHPGFTLPVGSPVLEERGWALGNGRVSVLDHVASNGTVEWAEKEVLSIVGNKLSLVTTMVFYASREWTQSRQLTTCAIACSQFVLTRPLLPTPAVINYLTSSGGYFDLGHPRTIDGLRVREVANFGSQAARYWITTSSHLVVRIAATPTSAGQFDFQWNAPTKANEKLLALAVPSGFMHFTPPKSLRSAPKNLK